MNDQAMRALWARTSHEA